MSRSYKKAVIKDKTGNKPHASRKVRRTAGIPDGGHYKKVYNPYDISDWAFDMRWGEKPCRGAIKTRNGWMVPK